MAGVPFVVLWVTMEMVGGRRRQWSCVYGCECHRALAVEKEKQLRRLRSRCGMGRRVGEHRLPGIRCSTRNTSTTILNFTSTIANISLPCPKCPRIYPFVGRLHVSWSACCLVIGARLCANRATVSRSERHHDFTPSCGRANLSPSTFSGTERANPPLR